MGELNVQVRLHGAVVEDRVLAVRDRLVVGDWPGAAIGFPGASIQVSRAGGHLRVLGRRLGEGESVHLELGDVGVTMTHTEPLEIRPRATPTIDHRFLGAAVLMVGIGTWIDAAESWIDRMPANKRPIASTVMRDVVEAARYTPSSEIRASRPFSPLESTKTSVPAGVGEGPKHRNDDHKTGVGYHRWYRNMIPADGSAFTANEQLEKNPNDAEARRVVARAAYHAGRFGLSAWHYRNILAQYPHDTSARLRLAWSARRQGLHGQELHQYQHILDEQPQNILALGGAATALTRLGRFSEARDTMDALQILAPTSAVTESSGAIIEGIHGEQERAIASLRRALDSREQLAPELQLELRQDIAVDPAFAAMRADWRLRSMLRRSLGAAAPRGWSAKTRPIR